MFDYLNGYITDKRKNSKGNFVTIDVSDIGYILETTESDYNKIQNHAANKQRMYVYLAHREDIMALYGFINKESRDIFQILLSVSGVGAKMAIALLNEFDVCNLIAAVINGNYKELTLAKGVGPKLAQKIILELKDKLIKTECSQSIADVKVSETVSIKDAKAALYSLGYEENEIESALKYVSSDITDSSTPEEVLRKVLTTLSV